MVDDLQRQEPSIPFRTRLLSSTGGGHLPSPGIQPGLCLALTNATWQKRHCVDSGRANVRSILLEDKARPCNIRRGTLVGRIAKAAKNCGASGQISVLSETGKVLPAPKTRQALKSGCGSLSRRRIMKLHQGIAKQGFRKRLDRNETCTVFLDAE